MAGGWNFGSGSDCGGTRPDHASGASAGLFADQEYSDTEHVLPYRRWRPLGRRFRQAPQLGLPPVEALQVAGEREPFDPTRARGNAPMLQHPLHESFMASPLFQS